MKNISILIIGLLLSPLILIIVAVVIGLVNNTSNWSELFAVFFVYVYPTSLIGIIMFGIPCSLILKHFDCLNYITLAFIGFIGGAVIGAQATPIIGSMLLYGSCGLLSASGFWFFLLYAPTKISIEKMN